MAVGDVFCLWWIGVGGLWFRRSASSTLLLALVLPIFLNPFFFDLALTFLWIRSLGLVGFVSLELQELGPFEVPSPLVDRLLVVVLFPSGPLSLSLLLLLRLLDAEGTLPVVP